MSFDALAGEFAAEAVGHVEQLERGLLALEGDLAEARRATASVEVRGSLHTLKGNAGLVGAVGLQAAVHALEGLAGTEPVSAELAGRLLAFVDVLRNEVLAIAQGRPVNEPSAAVVALAEGRELAASEQVETEPSLEDGVRVSRAHLDALVAAAGDLLVQNAALQRQAVTSGPSGGLRELADRMNASVRVLHEQVLRARSVPVGQLFGRYQRLVRDEGRAQGKPAVLVIEGGEVELDKAVLDLLATSLVHLVRNAVAHGLEPAANRQRAYKPATGRVTLSARRSGAEVELGVADDGAGIDEAAVRRQAEALGLNPAKPAASLIFEPGFSTAALSTSSGRGVGLDVVRRSLHHIGGSVAVESVRGVGTRFVLRVPASIAVQRAVLCELSGETYALPAVSVVEASRLRRSALRWLGTGEALEHRGGLVPVVSRASVGLGAEGGDYAVVLRGDSIAALRVDGLVGQQDLVVHPLEASVRGASPASGAALLSDGRVVLQLDPHVLIGRAVSRSGVLRP
ncbi:MAG: chemotaxis protein CheW [Archangium sp.]|nr:chemotaxis protein CheW [Archangium sp.]